MNTIRLGDPVVAGLVVLGLWGAMLLGLEWGRRLGKRRMEVDPEGARTGLGAVEASLFGLLGLLVAFTFGGAATRFDHRRDLIIAEANAIGTAWMRLDMVSPVAREELRGLFGDYLDRRLELYRSLRDLESALAVQEECLGLQGKIWERAVAEYRAPEGQSVAMLVLPALNEMFDVAGLRTMALRQHPPAIIFVMLFFLSVSCSALAGYGMAGGRARSLMHMVGFATIMALAIFVIMDLEYPRLGWIQVSGADLPLLELRAAMGAGE